MPTYLSKCPQLIIPNGGTESNALEADKVYSDAIGLALYAPASLTGVVSYTLEGRSKGSTVWRTIQDGDPIADLAPPLAGKTRVYYNLVNFDAIRIKVSGPTGAQEIWDVDKLWSTD